MRMRAQRRVLENGRESYCGRTTRRITPSAARPVPSTYLNSSSKTKPVRETSSQGNSRR